MRFKQFDIDLSEAVRVHTCLYDRSDGNFNHREYVLECWNEVATKCALQNGDAAHRAFDNLRKRYNKVKGKYNMKDPSNHKEHDTTERDIAGYAFIQWLDPFIHRRRGKLRMMEDSFDSGCSMVERKVQPLTEGNNGGKQEFHARRYSLEKDEGLSDEDGSMESQRLSSNEGNFIRQESNNSDDKGRFDDGGGEDNILVQIHNSRSLNTKELATSASIDDVFRKESQQPLAMSMKKIDHNNIGNPLMRFPPKHNDSPFVGYKRKFNDVESHKRNDYTTSGVPTGVYQEQHTNIPVKVHDVKSISEVSSKPTIVKKEAYCSSSVTDVSSLNENDLFAQLISTKIKKLPRKMKLRCENELLQTLFKYELLAEEENCNVIPTEDDNRQ